MVIDWGDGKREALELAGSGGHTLFSHTYNNPSSLTPTIGIYVCPDHVTGIQMIDQHVIAMEVAGLNELLNFRAQYNQIAGLIDLSAST